MMKTKAVLFFMGLGFLLVSCDSGNQYENLLNDTRWEVYQYLPTSVANPLPLTDTIHFSGVPTCTYNGNPAVYRLIETNNTNNAIRLSIENTSFGNITGIIQVAAVNNGQILGENFSQQPAGNSYLLWFRKIN